MIAVLAVHTKNADNEIFITWLALIRKIEPDPQAFAKRWLIYRLDRLIKGNTALHQQSINCSELIHVQGSKLTRWIASNTLQDLRSNAVQILIN
jgi:hypothetical protein